jgi:mannose-6-phosphate isomerase-like protein (cupin superfamily)
MRTYGKELGPNTPVGDVDVFRWDRYDGVDLMPFKAMWYQVPAGGRSPTDQHPEHELSIVVSGSAAVQAGGGDPVDVPAGGAFLLDSGEAHLVHNRSAEEPLVIFSAYWMPAAVARD